MSRAARLSLHAVLILGLGTGALTACGDSSSSAKSSDATTTSSASDTPTTKVAAAAATEPATDPIAATAALKASDLGAGYAEYRKADGVKAVGSTSCSVVAPGATLTTQDHVYSGPMFKKKDASFFVYSEAYTFRTEDLAKQFAAFRATAPYKQCKQKQDNETTGKARPGNYVKLDPVKWADPSGHIPTMYRELTGTVVNGKQSDGGVYDRYTFQRGRVVVVLNIDAQLATSTEGSKALDAEVGRILDSLDAALTTRLAAA